MNDLDQSVVLGAATHFEFPDGWQIIKKSRHSEPDSYRVTHKTSPGMSLRVDGTWIAERVRREDTDHDWGRDVLVLNPTMTMQSVVAEIMDFRYKTLDEAMEVIRWFKHHKRRKASDATEAPVVSTAFTATIG